MKTIVSIPMLRLSLATPVQPVVMSGDCAHSNVTGTLQGTVQHTPTGCGPLDLRYVVSGLPSTWTVNGKGACQEFEVLVTPDDYPAETSWRLYHVKTGNSILNHTTVGVRGMVWCRIRTRCAPPMVE
jgi:hypothetical protein